LKIGITIGLPVFDVLTESTSLRKSTDRQDKRHTSPIRIPVHAAATVNR
jgi:hypothetical protein